MSTRAGRATAGAFPAGDPIFPFSYEIDAVTHINKLDQDIPVNGGTFVGGIDLNDGELEGDISLPTTTFTFELAGIVPLVTATVKIVPQGPVTGMLDFDLDNYLALTATSTFNIRIIDLHAEGTTINLVGTTCRTKTPVTVTMSGTADLGGPSTMSGTFTLPPFQYCGSIAVTQALNLAMSGPGNTFTATATPN